MAEITQDSNLLELTAHIASSHVANNKVNVTDLPSLLEAVYRSLSSLGSSTNTVTPSEPLIPAVSIKASLQRGYLICLEDGRKLKMLKGHLRIAYGLSPAAYRKRWGLPSTYPMVAPDYAEKRSRLAKEAGFGLKRGVTVKEKAANSASLSEPAPAKSGKRGRPKGPAR